VAILSIPDTQQRLEDPTEVRVFLADIGIDLEHWDLIPGIDGRASSETILNAYGPRIEEVKQRGGYTKVDVINVEGSTPGLDAMLERFKREHWHDEDEVRFTIYGRGVFHIHPADRPVVAIEVVPGDFIRVPRGVYHWFDLCADRRIVAIRLFQDPAGWTPRYTGSLIESRLQTVCFGPPHYPATHSGAVV
jgi:1,2-dihydroxy-3-keto-5-methylthiopentene dioxygenase